VHPEAYIIPNWPAPRGVKAYTTTRQGGLSQGGYAHFNLATYVGDDSAAVTANRKQLKDTLALPNEPVWLEQVHGIEVVAVGHTPQPVSADAAYTELPNQVCAVLTADCLPVLFCDRLGQRVAASHAGWRGLANGILEATVSQFALPPEQLYVWLGPAIGPQAFEVGDEVRDAFIQVLPQAETAFQPAARAHHWYADLYLLAQQRLLNQGVSAIYGGHFCTYHDPQRFYSYRRDAITGRMATLIWFTQ